MPGALQGPEQQLRCRAWPLWGNRGTRAGVMGTLVLLVRKGPPPTCRLLTPLYPALSLFPVSAQFCPWQLSWPGVLQFTCFPPPGE